MSEREMSESEVCEILHLMAEDVISLKAACLKAGRGYGNIRRRIAESEKLRALYAHARSEYQRAKVEEMEEIARKEPDVQRARLLCDVIKWESSKVLPKEFGDKLDLGGKLEIPGIAEFFKALPETYGLPE